MRNGSSSPSDVVRSYLTAFDRRDPVEIAAHVAPDFVNEHTAALGNSCEGHDVYLERLADFLDSMPELNYRVETLIADGPDVAVFYTMSGLWLGEHSFELAGAQRFHVADGLITDRTDYWDSAVFRQQVEDRPRIQAEEPRG